MKIVRKEALPQKGRERARFSRRPLLFSPAREDRRRAENDYKVNLKTEIMIEDLYDKVNAILAKQSALEKRLQTEDKNGRV